MCLILSENELSMSYLMMEEMLQNFQAGENHAKPENFACSETDDHQVPVQTPSKKKKKGRKNSNNSRRFSEQQIKLLESMFESETKLEPRKKMQLARELGLQPRQVAIWFQNKRARWKSKQIEKDYRTLKANYDNLASRFDSLKNERESLLLQLQRLNEQLLGSPCEGFESFNHVALGGGDRGTVSVHGNTNFEPEAEQGLDNTVMFNMCTTNDEKSSSREIENPGEKGHEFLNKGHEYNIDGSLAIPSPYEKWYSFDSGVQFDLSCNSSSASHWFNFWT